MAKILIVEDNPEFLKDLKKTLSFENHTIEAVLDGTAGLDRALLCEYDLLVLDWDLPGVTGVEICRQFRDKGGQTPVLLLTGKREIDDKECGLDAGADDYLTKPFNVRELLARVRALLRRSGNAVTGNVLTLGDVELDPANFKVKRAGVPVKLVPKEFAILELMLRNPGKVFSAEALFSRVWIADEDASPDVVRSHIKNLRKKLEAGGQPAVIHTVHGVGYRAEL